MQFCFINGTFPFSSSLLCSHVFWHKFRTPKPYLIGSGDALRHWPPPVGYLPERGDRRGSGRFGRFLEQSEHTPREFLLTQIKGEVLPQGFLSCNRSVFDGGVRQYRCLWFNFVFSSIGGTIRDPHNIAHARIAVWFFMWGHPLIKKMNITQVKILQGGTFG